MHLSTSQVCKDDIPWTRAFACFQAPTLAHCSAMATFVAVAAPGPGPAVQAHARATVPQLQARAAPGVSGTSVGVCGSAAAVAVAAAARGRARKSARNDRVSQCGCILRDSQQFGWVPVVPFFVTTPLGRRIL